MKDYNSTIVPIQKGDTLSLSQCPRIGLEREHMKGIRYASLIRSLMYVQVCTRSNISFVVGMLGRYQSNPRLDQLKAAKKVLRYL